ncbi:MAG TPA: hypothetical protein VMS17_05080 [Gemmataceae bacterium]|nr:hypothetical protein [Gemmataceae bacterium]
MKRALTMGTGLLLLILAACQAPPERAALTPLPDDSPPMPYAELLTRARYQSTLATEAFYVDKWTEVEDAARGLQQTARFLPKAQDIPVRQKDSLPVVSGDLAKEAGKLLEAAEAKDVQKTNDAIQHVQLVVHELRLDQ